VQCASRWRGAIRSSLRLLRRRRFLVRGEFRLLAFPPVEIYLCHCAVEQLLFGHYVGDSLDGLDIADGLADSVHTTVLAFHGADLGAG
jgi:hypothetical protein